MPSLRRKPLFAHRHRESEGHSAGFFALLPTRSTFNASLSLARQKPLRPS
jgi:hypothetical protein